MDKKPPKPAFAKGIVTYILVLDNSSQLEHALAVLRSWEDAAIEAPRTSKHKGDNAPRTFVTRRGDGCILAVTNPTEKKLREIGLEGE